MQIVSESNGILQLDLDKLQSSLEAKNLSERQVVAVSMTGALQNGKSFMLNYFLRFLYAKVCFVYSHIFFCFSFVRFLFRDD